MLSLQDSVFPLGQCQRWNRIEKRKTLVSIPNMYIHYNLFMRGVDRMDQNVDALRIGIRSKKWWWPCLSFALYTAVHNAWQLHRSNEAKLPCLL